MISRTTLMLSTAFAALAVPGIAAAQETAVAATAETATAEAAAGSGRCRRRRTKVRSHRRDRAEARADPDRRSAVDHRGRRRNARKAAGDELPGLSEARSRPQLDQSNPGEGRLILRGLNTGGVASTVAIYVDETPFGSSTGLVNGGVLAGDFDTFDVARVEVLRGPQGTLYGSNALGGVIKFVTARA